MKALTLWCAKLFLFWVGFFVMQQAVFLAFNHAHLAPIPWPDVLAAFRHGFPMNIAAAGYLTLAVALPAFTLPWMDRRGTRSVIHVMLIAFVAISALVNIANCGLFQAWGSILNRKALSYLAWPREAMDAVAGAPLIPLLLILIVECALGIFLMRRIRSRGPVMAAPVRWSALGMVPLTGLLLLAARGGPQDDPINKSWSFFSAHPVLNLSAVNGMWNALEIAVEPAEFEQNPYAFLPTGEAERIVADLNRPGHGATERILTTDRPNIVLILLESWSGDVIEPLGGEPGVTPHFNALCEEGLLFTNFFSTGFRTEQGLCAIISGFPSQPKTTIIRKYGKFDRLPSLVNTLDSNGYNSRWYYTGDVVFANTRSYLESMGFDVIHSEEDMPGTQRTRWGAYDEELFDLYLADSGSFRAPYLHAIMTATSHEPFDAPVDGGFPGRDQPQMYRNTVAYTDRCLGDFFDRARRSSNWENTLYIVVADHGHFLPMNRNHYDMERHRIACLLLGGALRPELRGTTNGTWASHVDLPATLLGQLDLPHHRFTWSKDLFDPATNKFAFYTFDEGFGYADGSQAVIYDAASRRAIHWRDSLATAEVDSTAIRNGKALLQIELERYMALDQ